MKVILTFRWFCFEFKPAIQSCHEFLNCTSGRLLICGKTFVRLISLFQIFSWIWLVFKIHRASATKPFQALSMFEYFIHKDFSILPVMLNGARILWSSAEQHLLTKFLPERERERLTLISWSINIVFISYQIEILFLKLFIYFLHL